MNIRRDIVLAIRLMAQPRFVLEVNVRTLPVIIAGSKWSIL